MLCQRIWVWRARPLPIPSDAWWYGLQVHKRSWPGVVWDDGWLRRALGMSTATQNAHKQAHHSNSHPTLTLSTSLNTFYILHHRVLLCTLPWNNTDTVKPKSTELTPSINQSINTLVCLLACLLAWQFLVRTTPSNDKAVTRQTTKHYLKEQLLPLWATCNGETCSNRCPIMQWLAVFVCLSPTRNRKEGFLNAIGFFTHCV